MVNSEKTVTLIENLTPWKPGVSGNPAGRPKGSRNMKSIIRDLLNDNYAYKKMSISIPQGTSTPLEAIIYTLIVQSIKGDVRASETLLKYAIDKDTTSDEDGFFSQQQIYFRIVNRDTGEDL